MGHFLSNNSHHQQQQQQQQQECKKWVHLPLTICEALRAFGAEFNCFLPCRSSCMANQRDKEEKTGGSGRGSNNGNGNGSSSCGAVFGRWLVAVQEGEGKGREIELVVGGEDDDERRESSEMMMRSSQRRHVFEDIEINDCGDENVGDEEARVSVCIPPKNALLLMRCRSDPVKMAALANRFWEAPMPKDEGEEEAENEREEEEEEEEAQKDVVKAEREERQVTFEQEVEYQEVSEVSEIFVSCEATQEQETPEAETEAESTFVGDEAEVVVESLKRSLKEETIIECQDQRKENEVEEDHQESMATEETLAEAPLDLEKLQRKENVPDIEQETQYSLEEEQPQQQEETEAEEEEECEENEKKQEEVEYQAITEEAGEEEDEGGANPTRVDEQEAETTQGRSELECPETREPNPEDKSKESESQPNLLPDCLLLMMCEPKLSMEVSKETWVCSTDFIRWVPEKKKQQPVVKQKDGRDEPKRRISIDSSKPPPIFLQPPRSSCSFPVAPPMATAAAANGPGGSGSGSGGGGSMATVIEQKLVGGKGYEPFVLTRCKSEPMRSSAKPAPDACFWKNRKLEPATLGVGAAGVGF